MGNNSKKKFSKRKLLRTRRENMRRTRERRRRDAWLKAVDREDLLAKFDDNKVRQNVYRICGDHFEDSCIKYSKNGNVKYLKANAFPTLNLPSNASAASFCQSEDVSNQNDEATEEVPILEMSESRQQEWMQRVEHEDIPMNKTAENHRICSEHYPTSMFVNERFYPETVPILYLPESSIKSEPCSSASSPTQCEVKLEIDESAPYLSTMTVETQTDHIATDGMHLNMCDAYPSTSKTVESVTPVKCVTNKGVQTLKKHSIKLKERKLQYDLEKSEKKRKKLENDIKELVSNIDATESVDEIKKKLESILKNATKKTRKATCIEDNKIKKREMDDILNKLDEVQRLLVEKNGS